MSESELETLRKAGIISVSKSSLKRKRSSKHFVFVDSADEGEPDGFMCRDIEALIRTFKQLKHTPRNKRRRHLALKL